jgi:hypothetical protein
MFKKVAIVAMSVVAVCILLIAPLAFVDLALARPPVAAAAGAYEGNATCSGAARAGLPPPTRPIPDSMRNGAPCAVSGAIVLEKDTFSGGSIGATHYALGLRSDSGNASVVTLEGDNAVDLWNAIQSGDRVVIQTLRSQITLVGDGTRTVRTESNPTALARSSALGLWIAGCMCVLEILAVGIFVALRRRSANPTGDLPRDI